MTAFSLIDFQMCSGRIGTGMWDMIGVGFLTVITTVVGSGAVTLVMLVT